MPSDSSFVAVSQRVVEVSAYREFRDCLDQQWAVWLDALGYIASPVPNRLDSPADFLSQMQPRAIVLSGGNNLASKNAYADSAPQNVASDVSLERDNTEAALVEYAVDNKVPLLGCCRGMQFLQVYFGGRLTPLADRSVEHVASTHEIALTDPLMTLTGRQSLDVNSFHDYGIAAAALAPPFQSVGVSIPDQTIEAFVHNDLPIVGIMWHPERPNPSHEIDLQLADALFASNWPQN